MSIPPDKAPDLLKTGAREAPALPVPRRKKRRTEPISAVLAQQPSAGRREAFAGRPEGESYRRFVERADRIDRISNRTLPVGVVAAMANADLGEQGVGRAASLLGRVYDLSPDWLLGPPEESQKGITSYTDPVTGGEITLETARRIMRVVEPKVIKRLLGAVTIPPVSTAEDPERGRAQRIRPNQVARFMLAMAPLDGASISFKNSLGAAVQLAQRGVNPDLFQRNLEVAAQAPAMAPLRAVSLAEQMALRGQRITSVAEAVRLTLPPEAQEAIDAAEEVSRQAERRRELSPEEFETTVKERIAEMSPEQREAARFTGQSVEQVVRQQMFAEGITLGAELSLEDQPLAQAGQVLLDAITNGQQDYLSTADEVVKQMADAKEAAENSPLGKAFGWVNDFILDPAFRFTMEVGRVLTLPIEIGQGIIDVVVEQRPGAFWDTMKDWGQDVHDIWAGKTTFGQEVMVNELHAPEWSAPIADLAVGIVLDPLIVSGRVLRTARALKTLTGTVRAGETLALPGRVKAGGQSIRLLGGKLKVSGVYRWQDQATTFLNGVRYPGRVRNFVERVRGNKTGTVPLKGMDGQDLPHFLYEAAKGRTTEDFFDAVHMVNATRYGTPGMYKGTMSEIHRFVNGAEAAALSQQEVVQEIRRLMAYALGAKVPQGSFAARAAVTWTRTQERYADYLYNPDRMNAQTFDNTAKELEEARSVVSQLTDWEIQVGIGRLPRTQELPHWSWARQVAGYGSKMYDDLIRGFREGTGISLTGERISGEIPARILERVRGTVRVLLNHPPRGGIVWDIPGSQPIEHYRRWATGSRGIFDDAEMARDEATLGRLLGAVSDPQRELKVATFLEGRNTEMVRRIAREHGFTFKQAEGILRRSGRLIGRPDAPEVYGVTRPLLGERQIVKAATRVEDPLFETQFANEWTMLDPAAVRRAFTDAQGTIRRFRAGLYKAAGKAAPASKDFNVTPTQVLREMYEGITRDIFLRFWKPLVVVRPAYIWRVPLLDENLRYMATLGFLPRLESTTTGARLVGRARHLLGTERSVDGLDDALRVMVPQLTELQAARVGPGGATLASLVTKADEGKVLTSAESRFASDVLASEPQALARNGFFVRGHNIVRPNPETITPTIKGKVTLPDGSTEVVEDSITLALPSTIDESLEELAGAGGIRSLARIGGEKYSEAIRQYGSGLRRGNAGVVFGTMQHGQEGFFEQLSHILKNQIGQSYHGNLILDDIARGLNEDEIVAHITDILTSSRGRFHGNRLMQGTEWADEALEAKVRFGVQVAREYTGANVGYDQAQIIAQAARDGHVNAAMLRAVPEEAVPRIHGLDSAMAFDERNIYSRGLSNIADWILQKPTNIINRHPYARTWANRAEGAMLRIMNQQKIPLTPTVRAEVRQQAREFAVTQVRRILFDFREQSRLGEMLSFVIPFFQPFSEAFVSWGRIIRQNPAVLGWANLAARTMEETGFVRRDPDSGELVIPMPNIFALGTAGGLFADIPGAQMSARLASFNLFIASAFPVPIGGMDVPIPVPGLSPPAMLVLQKMIEGDAFDWMDDSAKARLSSWAFEFGGVEFPEDLFPPWLNNLTSSIVGEDWQEGRVRDATVDFLKLQEWKGMPVSPNLPSGEFNPEIQPPPGFTTVQWQDEMTAADRQREWQAHRLQLAQGEAKAFFRNMTTVSLLYPAASQVETPLDKYTREFRKLALAYGDDPNGYSKAKQEFLERHPDLVGVTIAATLWNPDHPSPIPIPADPAVDQLLQHPEARKFAQTNPELVWALIPREVREADFDAGAWFAALAREDRQQVAPKQWLVNEQEALGWKAFFPLNESFKAWEQRHDELSETSQEYKSRRALYDDAIEEIRRINPVWSAAYDIFEAENLSIDVREKTEKYLQNKLFLKTDAGQGLKEYWEFTRGEGGLVERMTENGVRSIDSGGAVDLGLDKEYEQRVTEIIKRHPDFGIAYNLMYDDDLKGIPTNWEKRRGEMTPEQWEVFDDLATQWDDFDFKQIARREGLVAQGEGWFDRRVFINSVFFNNPDEDNPIWTEWLDKYPSQRDDALRSLSVRRYEYWTVFDRRVAGQETSRVVEKIWTDWARERLDITKADAAGRTVGPLYDQMDAQMVALVNKRTAPDWLSDSDRKILKRQVQAANDWGWRFEATSPFMEKKNPAYEFWQAWLDGVRKVQAVVTERKVNYMTDDYPKQMVSMLKEYRDDVLFEESPAFRRQWMQLEEEELDDLIHSFVPEEFNFPIGGFDLVKPYTETYEVQKEKEASKPKQQKGVRLYVEDAHLRPIAREAAEMWNEAVGATVVTVVDTDDKNAIPVAIDKRPKRYADAEFSENRIIGNRSALQNPITLAHEIGHALGLPHAAEGTTEERFIPWGEKVGGGVPAVGLMGSEGGQRSAGPTLGEIRRIQRFFGLERTPI